jgi:hypothetical protein
VPAVLTLVKNTQTVGLLLNKQQIEPRICPPSPVRILPAEQGTETT